MGIDFHDTRAGHEFFGGTMPRLVSAAESIAASLAAIANTTKPEEPGWIVAIFNHGNGDTEMYRTNGSEEKIREHLFRLISVDREEAGKRWQYGTETAEDIDFDGIRMYGCANIRTKSGVASYMINYVATKATYKTI